MSHFRSIAILACFALMVSKPVWARCEDHAPQSKPQNTSHDSVATHFAYPSLGYAVDDVIYAALQDGDLVKIFENYGVTLTPPELR